MSKSGTDRNEALGKYSAETVLSVPFLWKPVVSPTADRVIWFSDETGRPEVWAADLTSGTSWQVTCRDLADAIGHNDLSWVDDNYLLTRTPGQDGSRSVSIFAVDDGAFNRTLPYDLPHGDLAVTSDGRYLFTGWNDGLSRIDMLMDERRELVDWAQPFPIRIAPAEDWIAFDATEELDQRKQPCLCRRDGSDFTVITSNDSAESQLRIVSWYPSGDGLLIHDVTNCRLGVYTIEGDTLDWSVELQPDDSVVGLFDENNVLIEHISGELRSVPLIGDDDPQTLLRDTSSEWATPTGSGRVVVATAAVPDAPPQLLLVERDGSTRTLHSTEYGPVEPDATAPEELHYTASNGRHATVEVYHSHGEPAPAVGVVYSPWDGVPEFPVAGRRGLDYFVRQGYTVALAATPSERLTEDAKDDQIAFGEWLCDQEWVDDDRVGIFGHSAGGHDVANLLLTREETPWRAGLMYNGVPDLFAAQAHEPDNPKYTRHLGDPEENWDEWIAQSPIEHVNAGIDAPLRIHHGIEESRIPIEQIREFRARLEETGNVEGEAFEYHELPGENHISQVVAENARNLLMCVDFLDRRL